MLPKTYFMSSLFPFGIQILIDNILGGQSVKLNRQRKKFCQDWWFYGLEFIAYRDFQENHVI